MPFEKGDENINRRGRQPSDKPRTKRSRRETELRKVLNKLRPLVADAIAHAALLMNQKAGVSDATQLKAAMYLIDQFKSLTMELEKEEAEDDSDKNDGVPQVVPFSLTQVKTG